jgi:hypothetical protein
MAMTHKTRPSRKASSRKMETCITFDRTLKRSLKEQAAKERDVSSIVSETSKRYLNQKREQEREEREREE